MGVEMGNTPKRKMSEADQLDERRRAQIKNQVGTINRLLEGASYTDEMRTLHEQLAATEVDRDEALRELRLLRGDAS